MTQFKLNEFEEVTIPRVPEPRDAAVTEYVRMRLRELLDRKEMTGEQVALRVGVSPAYISSVWKTGVGARSIEGFAKLFGLRTAKSLREVAYRWYLEQTPKAAARAEEPAVLAAIDMVVQLHPEVTDAQLRTILHRFADDAFANREAEYWFVTLLDEVKRDYARALVQTIEAPAARAKVRRGQAKKVRGAFRDASLQKKRLAEIQLAELAPPVEAPKTAKRQA